MKKVYCLIITIGLVLCSDFLAKAQIDQFGRAVEYGLVWKLEQFMNGVLYPAYADTGGKTKVDIRNNTGARARVEIGKKTAMLYPGKTLHCKIGGGVSVFVDVEVCKNDGVLCDWQLVGSKVVQAGGGTHILIITTRRDVSSDYVLSPVN